MSDAIKDDLGDKIDRLATKLVREGYPGAEDLDSARRIARRMLEDSESRISDPATIDPDHEGVIRRSSKETASDGRAGNMRSVSDGE